MTAVLIDSNLLIGLAVDDHEHHGIARTWFTDRNAPFASCPITQGAVVRHLVRSRRPMSSAVAFVAALAALDDHVFWADDLLYHEVPVHGVIGHRQVTDAYLAQLARRNNGRVATLDKGFAALHPDVTELVPTKEQA